LKQQASRIHSLNTVYEVSSGTNTSRYFGCFMGLLANNIYDNNLGEVSNAYTSTATARDKIWAGRILIDHMGMSVVLRNNTTVPTGGSGIIDLDIYKVVFTRDVPLNDWVGSDRIEDWLAYQKTFMRQPTGLDIEIPTAGGGGIVNPAQNAGTTASNQVVGDRLWDNPPALRFLRVTKQWKVQVSPGQVVQFNMRSSRNKSCRVQDLFGNGALAAGRWLTQGYIFNMNGRYITGTTNAYESVNMVVEQYTRYNTKLDKGLSPTLVFDG